MSRRKTYARSRVSIGSLSLNDIENATLCCYSPRSCEKCPFNKNGECTESFLIDALRELKKSQGRGVLDKKVLVNCNARKD